MKDVYDAEIQQTEAESISNDYINSINNEQKKLRVTTGAKRPSGLICARNKGRNFDRQRFLLTMVRIVNVAVDYPIESAVTTCE